MIWRFNGLCSGFDGIVFITITSLPLVALLISLILFWIHRRITIQGGLIKVQMLPILCDPMSCRRKRSKQSNWGFQQWKLCQRASKCTNLADTFSFILAIRSANLCDCFDTLVVATVTICHLWDEMYNVHWDAHVCCRLYVSIYSRIDWVELLAS